MAIPKTTAQPSRRSLLRRIRALEAQLDELAGQEPRAAGAGPAAGPKAAPDPIAEVQELLSSGRPMAAVRRYQELTGADEATAREMVAARGGLDATGD